jgi:serine O-acetyltransferase
MSLWSTLNADLRANQVVISRPRTWANAATLRVISVLIFRLSKAAGHVAPLLASALKQLNHVVTGADLAWQAEVGGGLVLFHPTGVVIGPQCQLGARVRIQQGVTIGAGGSLAGPAGSPTIGSDVTIGPHACVLGPISVGDNSFIGANAVVVKTVPSGVVATGIPARWS